METTPKVCQESRERNRLKNHPRCEIPAEFSRYSVVCRNLAVLAQRCSKTYENREIDFRIRTHDATNILMSVLCIFLRFLTQNSNSNQLS